MSDILNSPEHQTALYRLLRGNALWFAKARAWSVTTHAGTTDVTLQELQRWSRKCFDGCLTIWPRARQAAARDAVVCPIGMSRDVVTSVHDADSSRAIDGCICPACLRDELIALGLGDEIGVNHVEDDRALAAGVF